MLEEITILLLFYSSQPLVTSEREHLFMFVGHLYIFFLFWQLV